MAIAMDEDSSDVQLERAYAELYRTRPTAVNLRWALDDLRALLAPLPASQRAAVAWKRAGQIADEDVETCHRIGEAGLPLIAAHAGKDRPVNVLTHCNAGWLATVDWGTALAPIYMAHDAGIPVHVWVDETRPRNQGASLTAFELGAHGVPHTVIADNTGGHLMQHGLVDLCIVGTDRTTARGDVCNKIGTYLKALAAHANKVPFYVALPHTTIDWTIEDGVRDIPIEERDVSELTHMSGRLGDGTITTVEIIAPGSPAANFAFDVTPAHLVTALITDRGVCRAEKSALAAMFADHARSPK
jgi:methylthioribose-1-phosphate isomerase